MRICTECGEAKSVSEYNKNVSKRDGLQSNCKACCNIANAVYRAANPDKAKADGAKWRAANREKARASSAKERKENPEAYRIFGHNYRARKRVAGGKLSKGLSDKLYKLQRSKCACCGGKLGDNYHLDHRMPLALEGPNTDDNIQLLCATCNLSKGAKHPVDFMQQCGYLI